MKRITGPDIAHQVARELFKLSSGPSADRLVLERDGILHGGWAFGPAKDAIYRVLARELQRQRRQKRREAQK